MDVIVQRMRNYVLASIGAEGLHGIGRCDRVCENGKRLITLGVKPLVVCLFAYLHDSCRHNDGEDIHHGERAAKMIDSIRDTLLSDVCDEDISLLKEACRLNNNDKYTIGLRTMRNHA